MIEKRNIIIQVNYQTQPYQKQQNETGTKGNYASTVTKSLDLIN